jgi:molecular chaperone Hsp33
MKESRLYSFIDNKSGFTIHFLEGSKLLKDIESIHKIGKVAKPYYAKTILTAQQMITFLKPGESLGIYTDSEQPYFRFKIETNFSGIMRTLLLPEEFEEFPSKLTGVSRITKIFPNSKPYTSVLEMNQDSPDEIINNILKDSYQTNSRILTSDNLDQSIMITKLPKADIKKVIEDTDDISRDDFIAKFTPFINDLFSRGLREIEEIVDCIEEKGFTYIHSKEVKFQCPCSEERMATNLRTLANNDLDHLFEKEKEIEVRCDYCNTNYKFDRKSLSS